MKRATSLLIPTAILVAALLACKGTKPAGGEACATEGDNACETPTTHLACRGGKWAAFPCKGPTGCKVEGDLVTCDATIAEADTPCDDVGNGACSVDKKSYLECKSDKWQLVNDCLGPKACSVKDEGATYEVNCDETLAKVGGLCTKAGDIACSVDKKAQLKCTNSKWSRNRRIRSPSVVRRKK
jgi:hypothetical protein